MTYSNTNTNEEMKALCQSLVSRVDEQGRSLFSPYLATYRLKYANWIEEHYITKLSIFTGWSMPILIS